MPTRGGPATDIVAQYGALEELGPREAYGPL